MKSACKKLGNELFVPATIFIAWISMGAFVNRILFFLAEMS